VPYTSVLAANGNWHTVFYLAAGLNAVAAIMSLAVLRPMRMRQMQADGEVARSAARPSTNTAAA
jgi:OFA family oxalate/formate antiporter-like MFS transporter